MLLTNASLQVEAKQDAAAKLTLILDDGVTETVVGTRYLLSGRAASRSRRSPRTMVTPPSVVLPASAGGASSKPNKRRSGQREAA